MQRWIGCHLQLKPCVRRTRKDKAAHWLRWSAHALSNLLSWLTLNPQASLIEQGARQLLLVFARWTKETSPQFDAGALYDKGKLLLSSSPPSLLTCPV